MLNRFLLCSIFSWVDGTPVTYTAWDKNEPNFANNDENCVTIYQNMGKSLHTVLVSYR